MDQLQSVQSLGESSCSSQVRKTGQSLKNKQDSVGEGRKIHSRSQILFPAAASRKESAVVSVLDNTAKKLNSVIHSL